MATLVELFDKSMARDANGPVIKFREGASEEVLSRAQLFAKARAIGARLAELAAVGERALMVYPSGPDFLAAFCGAMYAGVAAVPVYPPDRRPGSLERFAALIADAEPTILLGTDEVLTLLRLVAPSLPVLSQLRWLATDKIPVEDADGFALPKIAGTTVAYIQYTSGSTGTPRGVIHLNQNVAANIEMIRRTFPIHDGEHSAIWLPLYHDMGLINSLTTISHGGFIALMSPTAFLRDPMQWLRTISRERTTISAAPNFAYDLCARKATAKDFGELDLRCWEIALNGAEPVRADTIARFSKTFAPCGFRSEAFAPSYGLAEATLLVSFGPRDRGARVIEADEAALAAGRALPAAAGARSRTLVASGRVAVQTEVAIVDPTTRRRCAPGGIGEVWVRGDGIGRGYWKRPEETETTFCARIEPDGEGPFLRTGDLGFIDAGQLCITGRSKDVIVIHGKNHYPYDIEAAMAAAHPAVRVGCCVATSLSTGAGEGLALFFERSKEAPEAPLAAILDAVQDAVVATCNLSPVVMAVLEPGSIPKTSSGKLRRGACRDAFLAGQLTVLALRDLRLSVEQESQQVLARKPAADVESVCARIQDEVRAILGREVGPDAVLTRIGIDSVAAMEIMFVLEDKFELSVTHEELAVPVSILELSKIVVTKGKTALSAKP
jgi:acyl-CoA synthetase (AMP-forming)/AMP-acid ligase II/acyl carrier protein